MKRLNILQIGILIIGLVASATCRAQNGLMLTTVATLPNFDGAAGPLVQGNDGALYGAMQGSFESNDWGSVIKVTLTGSLTTLATFNGTNGAIPQSSPVLAPDGYFFGATAAGTSSNFSGYNQGYGTIYRMDTNGVLTTLFYFDQTNGEGPVWLTLGNDGSLYGVTSVGGPNGDGTIFNITTNGNFTLLVSFNGTNGSNPTRIIQASDGNFYGTTYGGGGTNGSGTVFRMTPDGQLTNLAVFNGTNGAVPEYIMQASDGCLYGTTAEGGIYPPPGTLDDNGAGVVFKVTTNGDFTVLAMFDGTNGAIPTELTEISNGVFYCTTESGGENDEGVLFEVTTNGDLAQLLSFGATPALPCYPVGPLTQASDGNYYGFAELRTTINNVISSANIVFSVRPIQAPVLQPLAQGGQLNLSWNAWAGYSYNLMYETNLTGSNWTLLSTITPQTNGITSCSDTIGPDTQRFYSVVMQLP